MTPEEKRKYLDLRQECIKLRKELESLCTTTGAFLFYLDKEMLKPSDMERGKRIAKLCNALQIQNDIAMHIVLKIPFKSKKWKRMTGKEVKP
jgi:hypothetical protein